jgi:hypothetical protein
MRHGDGAEELQTPGRSARRTAAAAAAAGGGEEGEGEEAASSDWEEDRGRVREQEQAQALSATTPRARQVDAEFIFFLSNTFEIHHSLKRRLPARSRVASTSRGR